MRICLYTGTALPNMGGQELVVDALARQFNKLGHEALVLAPYPRKLKPRDEEFPYPVVRHRRLISTRYFVGFYRRYLLALHRERAFDVVHCHDAYPTGYLAALCRDELGVPVVITSHGGDVRADNPRFKKKALPARYRQALESADAVISISQFTDEGIARVAPAAKRVVRIPNGVDVAAMERQVARPGHLAGVAEDQRYLLFLGRLHRRKGVDVLLKAMAELPLAERMRLVIAGDGPEREALQQLAQELGIGDGCAFVGRVEGDAKVWLLQHAYGVIIPSRGWEAFPLVVLEAFAAGRPVVASRIFGLRELIDPDQTGMLFDEDDAGQLAQCLRRMIGSGQWVSAARERCREVARRHDWGTIASEHLELYGNLKS